MRETTEAAGDIEGASTEGEQAVECVQKVACVMTAEDVHEMVENAGGIRGHQQNGASRGSQWTRPGRRNNSKGRSRFEQARLHHEDVDQHDTNTNGDIPGAHRLPFEGGRIGVRAARVQTRAGVQMIRMQGWLRRLRCLSVWMV